MATKTQKPLPAEREAASENTHADYSKIDTLLHHLAKVKRTGPDRWIACCPSHADKTPSLAIRQISDGTILLKCFSGCTAHEIVSAVGMNLSDLFPNTGTSGKPVKSAFPAADVLRCLQHEVLIVRIVMEELLSGGTLSFDDAERAKLAVRRIMEVEL